MRLLTCFYLFALLTLSMGVNAGPALGSVAWSASVATSNSLSTTSTGDPSIWCDERLAVIPEGRLPYAQSCVATVLAITTDLSNNATTSVVLVALNASSGQPFASLPLPVSSPGTPSVDNGLWPSYSGWVTCLPPPAETRLGTACATLVTSTAAGIFAANVNTTGGLSLAWEVYFSAPPPEGTPAHCTVAALANVVMCTVEAGRKSTLVTAYNVSTGDVVWTTDDQGFTLVWLANAGTSAVYGGRTMADGDLAIVARAVQGGAPQWRLGNLTFSPPGLWDNPNLDVDRDPKCSRRAFMYGKPHIGPRTITALDGATGQQLWELRDENATVIADYDTFAAECDFFRLRIYQALPSDVPRTVLQRVYGVDGVRRWTTRLANFTDTNGVLLVGAGRVFVFGLTSNMIGAVTSDTGAQLGSMQMQGAISSGHTFALALNDTTTVDAFVLAETVTTTGGSQTSLVVVQLPTL